MRCCLSGRHQDGSAVCHRCRCQEVKTASGVLAVSSTAFISLEAPSYIWPERRDSVRCIPPSDRSPTDVVRYGGRSASWPVLRSQSVREPVSPGCDPRKSFRFFVFLLGETERPEGTRVGYFHSSAWLGCGETLAGWTLVKRSCVCRPLLRRTDGSGSISDDYFPSRSGKEGRFFSELPCDNTVGLP